MVGGREHDEVAQRTLLSRVAMIAWLASLFVSLYLATLKAPSSTEVVGRYAAAGVAMVAAVAWGLLASRARRMQRDELGSKSAAAEPRR